MSRARAILEAETPKSVMAELPSDEIEIRCHLQDNRLHSGREVSDPGSHFDRVVVSGRDWPKVEQLGLWLEPDPDERGVYWCGDLYVTELQGALDDAGIKHDRWESDPLEDE